MNFCCYSRKALFLLLYYLLFVNRKFVAEVGIWVFKLSLHCLLKLHVILTFNNSLRTRSISYISTIFFILVNNRLPALIIHVFFICTNLNLSVFQNLHLFQLWFHFRVQHIFIFFIHRFFHGV